MSTPSPFETARQIGTQGAEVIRNERDKDAIDQILEDAKSEEDMDRAMLEVRKRISPQNQQAFAGIVENKKKKILKEREKQNYSDLGTKIRDSYPNSPFHTGMADILESSLDTDDKQKVMKSFGDAMKSIQSKDPYKKAQQERLNRESVVGLFDKAIKEIDVNIKNSRGEKKKKLQKERQGIIEQKNIYSGLSGFIGEGSSIEKSEKVVYDFDNPKHREIFKQIDEEFNGDEEKVTEEISKIFIIN